MAAAVAYCAAIAPAQSADLAPSAAPAPSVAPWYSADWFAANDRSQSFEVRFGEYIHGVGSVERYTPDVSASIVTPRLSFGATGYWTYFVPRLQLGGNYNVAGRTSFAYLDILYTVPVTNWLFVEPFFGGGVR